MTIREAEITIASKSLPKGGENMRKLLKGCGRLVGLFLTIVLLAAVVGLSSPVSASEPPTITCTQDVVIDPKTGLHTFVTILTIAHDGELAQVILRQPPEGPLSTCKFP